MKGKVTVYMHYRYRDFGKRVEQGMAFWEPVTVVPAGVVRDKNFASSLDAVPALDESGFPTLSPALFLGQKNDATPSECVSNFVKSGMTRFRVSQYDPVLVKQPDGTYGMSIPVYYYRHHVEDSRNHLYNPLNRCQKWTKIQNCQERGAVDDAQVAGLSKVAMRRKHCRSK